MLSRLRPPKLTCAAITRVVVAGMLLFVLLAGIVPGGTFSSLAEQTCTMSCCAGKPPHAHGSCGMAFSEEPQPESHAADTHTEVIEAASHCGTTAAADDESKEASQAKRAAPRAEIFVKAHALTMPCSPECAAAASSAFMQVKRGRDASALATNTRPLAPAYTSLAEHISNLQKPSAARGSRSGPRAPPRFS